MFLLDSKGKKTSTKLQIGDIIVLDTVASCVAFMRENCQIYSSSLDNKIRIEDISEVMFIDLVRLISELFNFSIEKSRVLGDRPAYKFLSGSE